MTIKLSDHFTYGHLVRFTLPSVIMMVFTSIYSVVDGFFVSNYVGKTPFAAINLIMPFLMLLGAVGFMFGTGGSALIAMKLGMGDSKKANEIFSMLVYISALIGIVLAVLGIVFVGPIAQLLGAEGKLLDDCVIYARINLAALPFFLLQFEFQSFMVTAEKPRLGLAVTVASGVSNMILDALLIAVFRFGLVGAAIATAASQIVGGLVPLLYFICKNSSLLHLCRTSFDARAFIRTCTNGSSELMSNVSTSLVSMLYNTQLMKYAGENGVAAYGVLMYVNFIFIAVYLGYSVGAAPVIGFHHGAQNKEELKGLLRKSLHILLIASVSMFLAGELLAYPLSKIFVGYDTELMSITLTAFRISSFSFLVSGIAIFGSSFFTALGDGLTSALISFLRTLIFQTASVLVLPMLFGITGIWFSIVAAEAVAVTVTAVFIIKKRRIYGY